ncbi:unnamed protein product [Pelagomonas calceolata]|uniref:Uncharacterized protein n=1 Tax=Pelagomonas calceolata TaxID=35677 RepID=A0A8J2SWI0_9STRA|nr:unnamed protein product [Pelagomonas calceolata]|mmetsp:Transcript_11048/g.32687  ORF Transcript_11048/g.32687 Transcript_11048/m.32687 type:complete len:527 (+) Transcript_11048:140-1720(+)
MRCTHCMTPQNGAPRSTKRTSKTADADVAAYLNSCRAYNVTPDPATSTTLATGWWLLAPSLGFGRGGLLPLIDVLAESKSITELKLRADGERGASPAADARALAEILKRNQSLETLDLSQCGLDDVSIEELAQGLRESSLRTLILTENYTFGDDACAALAEAVRQAPSLERIDVSNNSLYFPGVSKISTASKQKNVTVESVGNFSTEEMLSALTHGLSFVVALVACIPLLTDAYQADRFTFWCCVAYEATLLVCFGSSTLYHGHFSNPKMFHFWMRVDHMGIYLLIAGSYTALISVGCRGHVPIAIIVALEWLLAGGGCLFSAAGVGMSKTETNWLELATFGVMGFACLPCIGLIKEILGTEAIFLVGLGGAFYVIGVIPFILADKHPGWHVVWHLFVMAGAVTHWFCVYLYVVPSADGAKTFDRDDLREIVSGLKSDVYNTTGSLEVALLSHALSMNTSTAAALVDEYRRSMSSFLSDHTPRPSLPRYFRKRWDRLTQRLEGVEAVAPAVEEVVEVAKKKRRGKS